MIDIVTSIVKANSSANDYRRQRDQRELQLKRQDTSHTSATSFEEYLKNAEQIYMEKSTNLVESPMMSQGFLDVLKMKHSIAKKD